MVASEIEHATYESFEDIVFEKINNNKQDRSFYVADFSDIYAKHQKWINLLPRVRPYYAVKCNNLPQVLGFLASLGTSFDCASKQEIEQVLALGVSSDKIIYANPCKTNAFIRHARNVKVDLMTFDNELELYKVAQLHPNASLVIRIKGDETSSKCKFNLKFGADLEKCYHLLKLAKQLNLNVIGVSFHNGSNCFDSESYEKSIASCKLIHEMGIEIGHKMSMVDLGGGFPGHDTASISFEQIAEVINASLDKYFSDDVNVDIIAEPGRYYVSSAMTLCTMVIAKREEYDEKAGRNGFMYYLNDGVYSAFNNVIFDHYVPEPELIPLDQNKQLISEEDFQQQINGGAGSLYSSVMWGPTCDSMDCIRRDFLFPELKVGQWIMFKNMGAYSCVSASNFNGFDLATIIIANNIKHLNNSIDAKNINIVKNGKYHGGPATIQKD